MSEAELLSDSELIEAYRAGDTGAFAAIYDRYAARLFTAYLDSGQERGEAVESIHDTFLEAAERLRETDPPGDLAAWLAGLGDIDLAGGGLAEDWATVAPPALRARVLTKVDDMIGAAQVSAPSRSPSLSISLSPEWTRMGLFAVVTVVVGLIGFAVSAQFEPLEPPVTTPGSEPSGSPAAPATTSTTIGMSSTTAVTESTTSTETSGPASLTTSSDTIDFGGEATTAELNIVNQSNQVTTWALAVSSDAIGVSVGNGEIEGGATVTIELALDREEIGEGDLAETIILSWPDGEVEIAVVGSHQDNPIIHNPQASPGSVGVEGCDVTRTTVSARVRDTSPLDSVVVRWSPDGSDQRETGMEAVGNDMFEAVIGPFTTAGTAEVRIVAFDEHGNAGGATTAVSVTDCP